MLNKSKIFKKIKNQAHYGEQINLKKLSNKDCNKVYLSWLNNTKINKYLESRINKLNLKDLKNFVKKLIKVILQFYLGFFTIKNI